MGQKTPISIEGKIYLSTSDPIDNLSGDQAEGIYIYEFIYGDVSDLNERDMGHPAFVVIQANRKDTISDICTEIGTYLQNKPDSLIRFGVAYAYENPIFSLPTPSESKKHSITAENTLAQYIQLFNQTDGWKFRPVVHLSAEACKRETIQGLEMSFNQQLLTIEQETQYRPIIHTSFEIAERHLTDPVFGRYPLWLSDTNGQFGNEQSMPRAWKDRTWSFVEDARYLESGLVSKGGSFEEVVYGTNRFNGTRRDLDEFTEGRETVQINRSRLIRLR